MNPATKERLIQKLARWANEDKTVRSLQAQISHLDRRERNRNGPRPDYVVRERESLVGEKELAWHTRHWAAMDAAKEAARLFGIRK